MNCIKDSSTAAPRQQNVVLKATYGRPSRPDLGPHARYTYIGGSIGLGNENIEVRFKDHAHGYSAGLEAVLFNLCDFDELSRHMILAATAVEYGVPFGDMMRGVL